jgi:hypothetical protein
MKYFACGFYYQLVPETQAEDTALEFLFGVRPQTSVYAALDPLELDRKLDQIHALCQLSMNYLPGMKWHEIKEYAIENSVELNEQQLFDWAIRSCIINTVSNHF